MLFNMSTGKAVGLLSLLLADTAQATFLVTNNTQVLTGFPPCDALVAANLTHAVHFPSSDRYQGLVETGWALATRKQPWCFVLPRTAAEVSKAITTLQSAGNGAGDWHIAIRSGGHGSDNQNNIQEGVTIDLSELDDTSYNAETNVASVGTGARWQSVYDELDQNAVSVTGGREGVVGVGGLILGGGISWYSARTGFACDSVVNFEVVLASGEIVNANATTNADLWRALKGGSSNFGLATRFDLEAFPASNLTMEIRNIDPRHASDVVDGIAGFTDLDRSFADNALISMIMYNPENGNTTIQVIEVNTLNKANSPAYDTLNRIPTLDPPVRQSLPLNVSSQRSQVGGATINSGAGSQSILNDPRVMRYCIEQHNDLVEELKVSLGPGNFSTIADFQPLPSYFADIGVEKGGNVLGLERVTRNRILFVAGVTLRGPDAQEQYPRIYQQVAAMNKRIEAFSASIGSSDDFRYLPYADTRQDPLGSYGAANVAFLKQVASKYDPEGFFQRRVPGGFKLDRVA